MSSNNFSKIKYKNVPTPTIEARICNACGSKEYITAAIVQKIIRPLTLSNTLRIGRNIDNVVKKDRNNIKTSTNAKKFSPILN